MQAGNMNYLPKSEHTLPAFVDKFDTPEAKGAYVNEVLDICGKAS